MLLAMPRLGASRFSLYLSGVILHGLLSVCSTFGSNEFAVLRPSAFEHYIERFNLMEEENVTNFISNAESREWLQRNIPLFECPDAAVEEIYYFRWWSYRKHIKQTPVGFVVTEFLTPVKHAGAYNTISCAFGHHVAEGRWLRDQQPLDDYVHFWFRGNHGSPQPHLHKYSNWAATAVYGRFLVNSNAAFVTNLLDDFIADYHAWQHERRRPDGLFWQYDVRDGMEESISGSRSNKNARVSINSYMFANAQAIAAIARLAGRIDIAKEFDTEAARLKRLVQEKLWNAEAGFFEVLREDGQFAQVREESGFIPWYFNLPDEGRGGTAWAQLTDPDGFCAPHGIMTAERRHPAFRSHGCCTCEWDGAVWPFATSQTLTALANFVCNYNQSVVNSRDYFKAFLTYVDSQHAEGRPYVGEYLDEVTGDWINRTNRSAYYNHSTFADLLITGVAGLRPRADDIIEIHPLLPEDTWDWFCLDGVKYHGRTLTILWDSNGKRYHRGTGLTILADGKEIARAGKLTKLTSGYTKSQR
jgi:hypothetical protein